MDNSCFCSLKVRLYFGCSFTACGGARLLNELLFFIDEELKDERLCARFKTEEEVEKFRAAFQKGHDLIRAATGQVSGGGMLQFGGGASFSLWLACRYSNI